MMWGKIPLLLAATGAMILLGAQTGCSHSCTYRVYDVEGNYSDYDRGCPGDSYDTYYYYDKHGRERCENYGESCPYARCVAPEQAPCDQCGLAVAPEQAPCDQCGLSVAPVQPPCDQCTRIEAREEGDHQGQNQCGQCNQCGRDGSGCGHHD